MNTIHFCICSLGINNSIFFNWWPHPPSDASSSNSKCPNENYEWYYPRRFWMSVFCRQSAYTGIGLLSDLTKGIRSPYSAHHTIGQTMQPVSVQQP